MHLLSLYSHNLCTNADLPRLHKRPGAHAVALRGDCFDAQGGALLRRVAMLARVGTSAPPQT